MFIPRAKTSRRMGKKLDGRLCIVPQKPDVGSPGLDFCHMLLKTVHTYLPAYLPLPFDSMYNNTIEPSRELGSRGRPGEAWMEASQKQMGSPWSGRYPEFQNLAVACRDKTSKKGCTR